MSRERDRSKILHWIASFSDQSQRSLLVRPKKLMHLNAHQYTAQIQLGSAVAGGTALSFVQKDAFFGAVCEAVERLALRDRRAGRSSNGIALHTRRKEARARAARELIERHLFLAHYWGGVPFFKPEKHVGTGPRFQHAREVLKKNHAKLDLWEMRRVIGLHSYVVVISDDRKQAKFGLNVGCATKEDPIAAAESALCEALHVFYWLKSTRSKTNLQKYMKLKAPAPHDHGLLAWNTDYVKATKGFFEKAKPQRENHPIKIDFSQFRYQELNVTSEEDFPFFVSKATHPDLLDMIFHHPTEEEAKDAIKKLNAFWKLRRPLRSLPTLPHPFP